MAYGHLTKAKKKDINIKKDIEDDFRYELLQPVRCYLVETSAARMEWFRLVL